MEIVGLILYSSPTVALLIILIFFLLNPEKVEKWSAILARLLSFTSARMERAAVARDIQGRIGEYLKELNPNIKASIPYNVRIDWIKETNRESFIEEGEVVVVMSHHSNQARNFLNVVLELVSTGFLLQTKHFIEKPLNRALELTMAKKILMTKRRDAVPIFQEEIVEQVTDSETQNYSTILSELDERGLFNDILLPELVQLGDSLAMIQSAPKADLEVKDLINLLTKIARRKPKEEIDKNICGEFISMGIVLVASSHKIAFEGIDPYVEYIMSLRREKGIKRVYILARDFNIKSVRQICDRLSELDVLEEKCDTLSKINIEGKPRDSLTCRVHFKEYVILKEESK